MSRSPLGHRAPLCWLLLPFIVGLVLAKLSPAELPARGLLGLAMVGVIGAFALAWTRPKAWALSLSGALVAAGAAYYELRRNRLPEWDQLPPREAHVTVEIGRVFVQPDRPERFSALARVIATDEHLADLVGQPVAVNLRLVGTSPPPIRGERLRVVGILESLPRRDPTGDGFQSYLVDSGINFRLYRGRLEQVTAPPGVYARWREQVRQKAAQSLGAGLDRHPALSAALRGMMLGERHGLNDAQQNLFLRTGAMHFFAISGLHIGVIAGGLIGMLRVLRVPPRVTFLVSSTILAFYVDLTGAMPSAVRAWLMVVCLHGATQLRAPGNPISALALSALLVLILDPMQLFGAGFQMSYTIMVSLLLYGLPLSAHWTTEGGLWRYLPQVSQRWWHQASATAWHWFLGAFAITVAAALVGTLSGVIFFGYFAPVSLFANLLLMPLATGAILAGFASLLCTCLWLKPLVVLFNHAAALLLLSMQALLEQLTVLPGGTSAAQLRAAWIGPTAFGLLIGVLLWGYSRRWRGLAASYWAPIGMVAVILLVGMRLGD